MTTRFLTAAVVVTAVLSSGVIFSAQEVLESASSRDIIFFLNKKFIEKRTDGTTFHFLLYHELRDCESSESIREKLEGQINLIENYLGQESIYQENQREVTLSDDIEKTEQITEKDFFWLQVCCSYYYINSFLELKKKQYKTIPGNFKNKISDLVENKILAPWRDYIHLDNELGDHFVHFEKALNFISSSDLTKKYLKYYTLQEGYTVDLFVVADDNVSSDTSNSEEDGFENVEELITEVTRDSDSNSEISIDQLETSDEDNSESSSSGIFERTVEKDKPFEKQEKSHKKKSSIKSQNTFTIFFLLSLFTGGSLCYFYPEGSTDFLPEWCIGCAKKSMDYLVDLKRKMGFLDEIEYY